MSLTTTNALVSVQDAAGVAVNVANGAVATVTPGGTVNFALQSTAGVQRWTLTFLCPAYPSLHQVVREWTQGSANLIQVPIPSDGIGGTTIAQGVQFVSTVTDGVQSIASAFGFLQTLGNNITESNLNVRMVTNAALAAYTNVSGVITANGNGVMAAVDGVTPVAGDRMLLTMGAAGADNGVYQVTSIGTAGAPFILTRAPDMAQGALITRGCVIEVSEGTLFASSSWKVMTTAVATVGTTSLSIYPRYSFGTATSATPITTTWLFASGTPIMLSQLTGAATTGAISAITPGAPGTSTYTVTGAGTYRCMNVNW